MTLPPLSSRYQYPCQSTQSTPSDHLLIYPFPPHTTHPSYPLITPRCPSSLASLIPPYPLTPPITPLHPPYPFYHPLTPLPPPYISVPPLIPHTTNPPSLPYPQVSQLSTNPHLPP